MAEPFREQVQALRDEMFRECESDDHLVPLALLIERLDDLLSLPCPTAEPHAEWCAAWSGDAPCDCQPDRTDDLDPSTIRDVTPPRATTTGGPDGW